LLSQVLVVAFSSHIQKGYKMDSIFFICSTLALVQIEFTTTRVSYLAHTMHYSADWEECPFK